MLLELNQSNSPKSRPRKFRTFEKVLPHEQWKINSEFSSKLKSNALLY